MKGLDLEAGKTLLVFVLTLTNFVKKRVSDDKMMKMYRIFGEQKNILQKRKKIHTYIS